MATTNPTRSPPRAQLNSNSVLSRKPRRLTKPVERLPVYENLFALNRDFEQVLADFARLQELGVFKGDLGNIFHIVLQETRCWANLELFEFLKLRERDDWARLGQLHHQWENELENPNDPLIEAAVVMGKRRKLFGEKSRPNQP